MCNYDKQCCYKIIICDDKIMDIEKCKRTIQWRVSLDNGDSYVYLCDKHFKEVKKEIPIHYLLFNKINLEDNYESQYAGKAYIY